MQNHPKDPSFGTRRIPLTREIYIDRDDFMEQPPKKYHRLAPGAEVRLRFSYVIRCSDVIKDADGRVTELRCQYDPTTAGGQNPDGRKVKGIIHWVSASHGVPLEVRLVDRLFNVPDPAAQDDFLAHLNPDSLLVNSVAMAEPALLTSSASSFQFERVGYFCRDAVDSSATAPVFIRTVTLRDTWARISEGDSA